MSDEFSDNDDISQEQDSEKSRDSNQIPITPIIVNNKSTVRKNNLANVMKKKTHHTTPHTIRALKARPEQFNIIVEYMERHGDLSLNSRGVFGRQEKWSELATLLNKSGDQKTIQQWRKTWSDIKNQSKKKYLKIVNEKRMYNLSELEERILKVICPPSSQPDASSSPERITSENSKGRKGWKYCPVGSIKPNIVLNQHGSKVLLHGEFQYHKTRDNKRGTSVWHCAQGLNKQKCTGAVSIDSEGFITGERTHSVCQQATESNAELTHESNSKDVEGGGESPLNTSSTQLEGCEESSIDVSLNRKRRRESIESNRSKSSCSWSGSQTAKRRKSLEDKDADTQDITYHQIQLMLNYMEIYGDLNKAGTHLKQIENRLRWDELAELLNKNANESSTKRGGESKSREYWRMSWTTMKSDAMEKYRKAADENDIVPLTDIERRILTIVGALDVMPKPLPDNVTGEIKIENNFDVETNPNTHQESIVQVEIEPNEEESLASSRRMSSASSVSSVEESQRVSTPNKLQVSSEKRRTEDDDRFSYLADKLLEYERQRDEREHEREMARMRQNEEIIAVLGKVLNVMESVKRHLERDA